MSQLRSWEWGYRGVDLYEDRLTWFEREGPVRFASGGACDQTLEHFLEHGPWVDDVPAEILVEVGEAVRTVVASRG